MYKINLKGKRFGKLVAIEFMYSKKYAFWNCQCDCGNQKIIASRSLMNKHTQSCGCLHAESIKKGTDHPRWTGFKEIPGYFLSQLVLNAKRRKLQIEISVEDIWNVYINQNKKCKYTGIHLFFGNQRKNKGNVSVDRIDSSKGYIKENIQLVYIPVNHMKWDLPEEEFLNLCKKIYDNSYNKYEG